MSLVLHPQTQREIKAFMRKPSHALGILGDAGTGKKSTARFIAESLLGKQNINDHSLLIVQPDEKRSISIDQSRRVTHFLKLKSVLRQPIARVVIVEDAHAMTAEAQQALLKTLEEPSPQTCIILSVAQPGSLLPTLHSRLTTIRLRRPSSEALEEHFKQSFLPKEVDKALLISNARIGLMDALLKQADHSLLQSIDTAKTFIRVTTYERLAKVDELSKQDFSQVLDALSIVSQAGFRQAVQAAKPEQAKRWHKIRSSIMQAQLNSRHNANAKLLLTNLALAL